MSRWEGRRYRPPRLSYAIQVDGSVYDLEKARQAHERMQKMCSTELNQKLKTPGEVCELPYPGIGVPPRRPGGDLKFASRAQFVDLVRIFALTCKHRGQGHRVYVLGPKGVGKSCYLRALSWLLLVESHEEKLRGRQRTIVVCLWSMEAAYKDLFAEVVAALRFTYCQAEDVLKDIDSLDSLEGIRKFMDCRVSFGEKFYFIVDGVEGTTKGMLRPDNERRLQVGRELLSLLQKAHVSVTALSPMADSSLKRKADASWIYFEQGFWKEEYDTYMNKVSVLGCLTDWQEEINYFAGEHPLSLSVLDSCCRLHAQKRIKQSKSEEYIPFIDMDPWPELTDGEIAQLLKDRDEWDEALKLFVSSAEMTSIRILLEETLSSLSSACHSQQSMMERDTRFVVGDPKAEVADYMTPYISRIYTEGFREAESRKVYDKAAWYQYCRYLLDQGGPINWSEMGWLVENLAAEVISFKGLNLNGINITSSSQTQRFGGVPDYNSWISKVEAGGVIYFIPLKYNYRSIDGLLVWRDAAGTLHLLAIQVTVNHEKHQASATDFMSFNNIVNWIPEEHLSKWKLHFVFLCLVSSQTQVVEQQLKPLKDGGHYHYGTVKHWLHTVSFQNAFTGLVGPNVLQTLANVARKRDEASQPAAEKEARAEAKAIADALMSAGPGPAAAAASPVPF